VIRVVAPASTANLGPGFDAAAAALDLWNEVAVEDADLLAVEVEGEGADETPRDAAHLGLRAFALLAPVEGRRFRFVNRIPYERGLGSSAAAIALGLLAGAAAAGSDHDPDELLALGLRLEGHADNLAAVLRGGVCLAWREGDDAARAVRIASGLPLDAVLVVPATRTSTAVSRNGLPASVTHAEAAASAGAAARLGAAIAGGDADLMRAALADRLHEPYRLEHAPLLAALRSELPDGAVGATLSGSGPSVVVWAEAGRTADVVQALGKVVPAGTGVLALPVAGQGAHLT
jgi:homoserine kinase